MSDDLMNEALKAGGVPEGYGEVTVDFYRFENEGDHLAGRLVNKTQTTVRGNRIGKYVLIAANNRRVTFLGGVDLDEKLANVGIGNEVFIQYTHKEPSGEKDYEMKRFRVFVKAAQ